MKLLAKPRQIAKLKGQGMSHSTQKSFSKRGGGAILDIDEEMG